MKKQTRNKIFAALTAAALSALLLAGCGQTPPAPESTASSQPASSAPAASLPESTPAESSSLPMGMPDGLPAGPSFTSPEQFLTDIQPILDCLASCDADLYGADVDWDTVLSAGTVSAEDPTIAVLFPEGDPLPEGFAEDPACAQFYPIRNYTSMADVQAWLEQYMMPAVAQEQLLYAPDSELLEFDGALYLVRGGRGYGMVSMDLSTLEYRREEDYQHVVGVQCVAFDEYDSTRELYFAADPDGWILTRMDILDEAVG